VVFAGRLIVEDAPARFDVDSVECSHHVGVLRVEDRVPVLQVDREDGRLRALDDVEQKVLTLGEGCPPGLGFGQARAQPAAELRQEDHCGPGDRGQGQDAQERVIPAGHWARDRKEFHDDRDQDRSEPAQQQQAPERTAGHVLECDGATHEREGGEGGHGRGMAASRIATPRIPTVATETRRSGVPGQQEPREHGHNEGAGVDEGCHAEVDVAGNRPCRRHEHGEGSQQRD